MKNINFFKKKLIKINKLFPKQKFNKETIIKGIKTLNEANEGDLTFFDSIKYKELALSTKASYCITNKNLEKFLPPSIEKIIVNNVLYELAKIIKLVYPNADIDYPDLTLKNPAKNKFKKVKFGNNVLLGKNVKIGTNSHIGSNTILEHDVQVGENCVIGSNVIIKNAIIKRNVMIQDSCKIGQKGFGFIPIKNKNYKFPHIGKVIISDDVEIASGCTIDRGSVDDTYIGNNTYIDNQVHIAHNVKIGSMYDSRTSWFRRKFYYRK